MKEVENSVMSNPLRERGKKGVREVKIEKRRKLKAVEENERIGIRHEGTEKAKEVQPGKGKEVEVRVKTPEGKGAAKGKGEWEMKDTKMLVGTVKTVEEARVVLEIGTDQVNMEARKSPLEIIQEPPNLK